jgi:hypothetical protein
LVVGYLDTFKKAYPSAYCVSLVVEVKLIPAGNEIAHGCEAALNTVPFITQLTDATEVDGRITRIIVSNSTCQSDVVFPVIHSVSSFYSILTVV